MNRIQLFLIGAVVYGALHISASVMAQAAPLNTPQITALAAANTYRLSWETVAGRLYFMQVTTDLQTWNYSAPQNWYYVPAVILGTGGPITWNFSATTVRGFVRLKYSVATNITAGATGDYDGDGIANLAEISEGTDPSLSDTDGDGLTDLQEKNGGTNPNDPDTDHDGLGDLQDTAPLAFQMPQITVEHAWRDAKIVHHNLICNNQQHVKLYRSFTSSHPPVGDPGGLSERTLPPFVLGGGHQNGLDTHLQVVAAWQAAGNDPLFTSGVPTWSGWRPFVIERDLLEGTLRREYSGNILTNAEISPGDGCDQLVMCQS